MQWKGMLSWCATMVRLRSMQLELCQTVYGEILDFTERQRFNLLFCWRAHLIWRIGPLRIFVIPKEDESVITLSCCAAGGQVLKQVFEMEKLETMRASQTASGGTWSWRKGWVFPKWWRATIGLEVISSVCQASVKQYFSVCLLGASELAEKTLSSLLNRIASENRFWWANWDYSLLAITF